MRNLFEKDVFHFIAIIYVIWEFKSDFTHYYIPIASSNDELQKKYIQFEKENF